MSDDGVALRLLIKLISDADHHGYVQATPNAHRQDGSGDVSVEAIGVAVDPEEYALFVRLCMDLDS